MKPKFSKKLTILTLLLVIGLGGIWAYKYKIVPRAKKAALTAWLNTPTSKTIYEKNNNPHYPKTTIELPQADGYLINVHKDQHKLQLLKNNEVIKEYDANVRREEVDRKIWEDSQTPEGIFTIETMDVVSDPPWERWMRLDTLDHSRQLYEEAYSDGAERIASFEGEYGKLDSDQQLREFNKVNSDQKILRGVGIHGGGFSIYRDWVEGCVALSDEDVAELFALLKASDNGGIGTKVVIQD